MLKIGKKRQKSVRLKLRGVNFSIDDKNGGLFYDLQNRQQLLELQIHVQYQRERPGVSASLAGVQNVRLGFVIFRSDLGLRQGSGQYLELRQGCQGAMALQWRDAILLNSNGAQPEPASPRGN